MPKPSEYRAQVDGVIAAGPYNPTWPSLQGYTPPDWYRDGKFGIFIHWGVYAVPGFASEWYPRNMYLEGSPEFRHHLQTYGPQTQFGYKDFIPMFTAEKFDPDAWAGLFRQAGAKFVVPVAEHHDGFAMYDCSFSRWNAVQMGPRRDVIGELAAAVRRQWLVFGLSSHRAEHWWFMNGGMACESDVRDARWADFYGPAAPVALPPNEAFLEDWLLRTCELVDRYQPQLVWFDWWIEQPAFASYLQQFAAYYYNRALDWRRGVAINYKNDAFAPGSAVLDLERGMVGDIHPRFWQNDTAVTKKSWGYAAGQDYKTVSSLIGDLVDAVSKNGALLLNIGPAPDGTIPAADQELLLGIGRWLSVNGEAIYGTRPWKVFGEGPTPVVGGAFNDTKRAPFTARDLRFTVRGETLYSVALGWPEGGRVTVRSLALGGGLYQADIAKVELLGRAGALEWSRDEQGLHVQLPGERPAEHALALRITPVRR